MSKNLYKILFDGFNQDADKVCLNIPGQKNWSYKEIDHLSALFASYLNGLGLKKGDRIICQNDKSVFAVGLYLGCLRMGLIYTPLNTSYTMKEVEYFIENIEPKLFVCSLENYEEVNQVCKKLGVPNLRAMGVNNEDSFIKEILSLNTYHIFES